MDTSWERSSGLVRSVEMGRHSCLRGAAGWSGHSKKDLEEGRPRSSCIEVRTRWLKGLPWCREKHSELERWEATVSCMKEDMACPSLASWDSPAVVDKTSAENSLSVVVAAAPARCRRSSMVERCH